MTDLLPSTTPLTPEAFVARARDAAARGDTQTAGYALIKALVLAPSDVEALMSMAMLLEQLGQKEGQRYSFRALCAVSVAADLASDHCRATAFRMLSVLRPEESKAARAILLGRLPHGSDDLGRLVSGPVGAGSGPSILVISDAFPPGGFTRSLIPSLEALHLSIRRASVCRGYVVHPDRVFLETGRSVAAYLDRIVSEFEIRSIVLYAPKAEGDRPYFPAPAQIAELAQRGIRTAVLFADALYPGPRKALAEYVDKAAGVITWDIPTKFARPLFPGKIASGLGAPVDESVYAYGTSIEQDIPVSFVGSVGFYPDRKEILDELRRREIPITVFSGQQLGNAQFVDVLHRSRISLNIPSLNPHHPPTPIKQVKARVFEAICCGSLLLDEDTVSIREFLVPYEHFVPYKGLDDLEEKIRFYLAHEEKRARLAASACAAVRHLWAPDMYWGRYMADFSLAE